MKTYHVVNGEFNFGFGGFFRKAFLSKEEAENYATKVKKLYTGITSLEIEEVQGNNKKEVESQRKSMFAGAFKGCDGVKMKG